MTTTDTPRYGSALDVACTRCGATPGDLCTATSGPAQGRTIARPHLPRINRANAHTPATVTVRNVRVPDALWNKARTRAAQTGTTVSAIMVAALDAFANPDAATLELEQISTQLARTADTAEQLAHRLEDLRGKLPTD